jgi:hypothetical protein
VYERKNIFERLPLLHLAHLVAVQKGEEFVPNKGVYVIVLVAMWPDKSEFQKNGRQFSFKQKFPKATTDGFGTT